MSVIRRRCAYVILNFRGELLEFRLAKAMFQDEQRLVADGGDTVASQFVEMPPKTPAPLR
jgi:hypothetical protein